MLRPCFTLASAMLVVCLVVFCTAAPRLLAQQPAVPRAAPEQVRPGKQQTQTEMPRTVFAAAFQPQGNADSGVSPIEERTDISLAWAGHPVEFALLTHGRHQFVGFYNPDRYMTIASRTLGSYHWTLVSLPTRVGWDSHNSIAMAVDEAEQLHVAGNMHSSPLIYFRTTLP